MPTAVNDVDQADVESTLSRYQDISTPAFVYDERILTASIERVKTITDQAGCALLYSLKPFATGKALDLFAGEVAGFSASSLFEARLARDVLGKAGSVHLTTPGLRTDDIAGIRDTCDYLSFNSMTQYRRFREAFGSDIEFGMRVNPQVSLLSDDRYDPCREASKLGAPLDDFIGQLEACPSAFQDLVGLHFHTNCDSTDFNQLRLTVERIVAGIGPHLLKRFEWVNFGGGYHFPPSHDFEDFFASVDCVKNVGLRVFVEPGAGLVRNAGIIVSEVVDLFRVDGRSLAVLDTTVNHMPEVFEYQFEPDILGDSDDGIFEYTLAGSSCLAGDIFGVYAFSSPLELGARVVFQNMGAYSLVKSHMFNGINRPSIYAATVTGQLVLQKTFGFADFTTQLGLGTT